MIGGNREVDYSVPRMQQLSNGLEVEISSMPEELPALDSYFRFYRPAAGELVFDIGAYCGLFTYELSKLVGPEGAVIAFKPDPLNVALLRRNIEHHALKNVTVRPQFPTKTAQLDSTPKDVSVSSAYPSTEHQRNRFSPDPDA